MSKKIESFEDVEKKLKKIEDNMFNLDGITSQNLAREIQRITVLEKNQILLGTDTQQYQQKMKNLVNPDKTYMSNRVALETMSKEVEGEYEPWKKTGGRRRTRGKLRSKSRAKSRKKRRKSRRKSKGRKRRRKNLKKITNLRSYF